MAEVTFSDVKAQLEDLEDLFKTAQAETSREKLLSVMNEALYRARNIGWAVEQLSRR